MLGQNPAVGSANGRMQREGLANLKWLVVRDFQMIETATFWKDGPEIASGELKTEDIDTEVFFFPAANHVEKSGTFTQTQRMLQWHHQAVQPPNDAQSELEFFHELGVRIRERLADSTDERDRPLLDLTWDYPKDAHGETDAEAVLRLVGWMIATRNRGQFPNDTAALKTLWLMICNIEDKRAAQRAKKAKRDVECNGYIEGAKATGWKQAINQLAVAYPDRFADYL